MMSDREKLESGKYYLAPNWLMALLYTISPVTVVAGALWFGAYKTDMESRSFDSAEQKQEYMSKVDDPYRHWNYKQLDTRFVPRTEVEYKLEDINSKVDKIMNKLNVK